MSKNSEKPEACQEFLAAFSDFRDGLLPEIEAKCFQDHLEMCASCSRYDRIVQQGVDLLRSFGVDESESSAPLASTYGRYADEGASFPAYAAVPDFPTGPSESGLVVSAVAAVAVLLGVAAWVPTFVGSGVPEIDVAPIIAAAPLVREVPGFFPQPAALGLLPADRDQVDPYRPLLYQYLPLSSGNVADVR